MATRLEPGVKALRKATARQHPIWGILRQECLTRRWLAIHTEPKTSYGYIKLMACGVTAISPEYRRRFAKALGRPEHELFLPDGATTEPAVQAPDAPGGNGHGGGDFAGDYGVYGGAPLFVPWGSVPEAPVPPPYRQAA